MKIEHLHYLVEVAHWQSMNLASDKLHITQQALSLAIKAIEAEVGVKVLERSYQGVTLTEEGKELVDLSKRFLTDYHQLKERFTHQKQNKQAQELVEGIVECLINPGLNQTVLPRILSRLYRNYPHIEVKIDEYTAKEIVGRIAKGEGDIGLLNVLEVDGEVHGLNIPAHLKFVSFFDYKLCALVNKNSPLAKYKTLSISTLLREPFVLCSEKEDVDEYLLTKLIKHYGKPKIISANSTYLAKQMVIDNMAVSMSLVNDPFMIEGMENVKKIPINNKFRMSTGFLYNQEKTMELATKRFVDVLLNEH